MLTKILSQYWWMTLLRGLIAVLFGIVLFTNPGISLVTLLLTFGAFAFVDGVASVISAIGGRHENEHWGVLLLGGLVGIGVGVMAFLSPGITALAVLFYVAIWAIATGLLETVAAIRLRKEIQGEVWLGLAGLVSIAFGVFLMASPGAGILSLLWLVAGYALVFGVALIALSFRVRGLADRFVASH